MRLTVTMFAAALITTPIAEAADDDIFMIRTTTKSPDAIVAAIKDYVQTMEWQYLSDNKVKKGEVTLVKICIPEVGRIIWPLGLQLSAMLPCGNISIYKTDSRGAKSQFSTRAIFTFSIRILKPNAPVKSGPRCWRRCWTRWLVTDEAAAASILPSSRAARRLLRCSGAACRESAAGQTSPVSRAARSDRSWSMFGRPRSPLRWQRRANS